MVTNGYQPGTTSSSSRRADFDLRRRLALLEAGDGGGGGGGGVPDNEVVISSGDPGPGHDLWFDTDTNILYARVDGGWVEASTPATQVEEVFIGPDDPIATYPALELWVDSDDNSGGGGGGGTSGPMSYVHVQPTTSATWMVEHDLGWFPNVTVIDSAGSTVEGDIAHIDTTMLTISFSGAFTGHAYLS